MGSTTLEMDPIFFTQWMKFKVQPMQCNILVPKTQLLERGIVQIFQFANISTWTGNCRGDSNARAEAMSFLPF